MNVSIVIPNFNGKKLLEKNLPLVFKINNVAEIIVVDDGSTDDSINFLKKQYPQVKIVQKLFNDGFSTTVNLGAKAVKSELFVLINTDVIPREDFLKYLIPHFQNEKVFGVGCLEESHENGHIIYRGRGIGRFYHGFLMHSKGDNNVTNTLWLSGGSSIFRKSIWEQLGGMDEIYNPFYWEDIDLSYRALKSGYKILFEPKSIVEHHHEQGVIKTKFSSKKVKQITYRNQIIFTWKNITHFSYLISNIILLPYFFLKTVFNGDWAFAQGLLSAILRIPEICRHKKIQSGMYVKSDPEILKSFEN